MAETSFYRVTQTLRRQSWLLFGLFPASIILAAGLFWGLQRIVEQERSRLELDFSSLVGYANEQEVFLNQLRGQNLQQLSLPFLDAANSREIMLSPVLSERLFEGQSSSVDMPFSWSCDKATGCLLEPENIFALGNHLSDFYSSFWVQSYFPASTAFFVINDSDVSISVPAADAIMGHDPLSAQTFISVTNEIRQHLNNAALNNCNSSGEKASADVFWFQASSLPGQLVGLMSIGGGPNTDSASQTNSKCIYAATLLNPLRIGLLERTIYPVIKSRFWLQHRDGFWLQHNRYGTLLGLGIAPKFEQSGLHFTTNGLVFKVVDNPGTWTGYYLVSYMSFFQNNYWLPASAAIFFILSALLSLGYSRWYGSRVIVPAQKAQREILESDQFNRTLIHTAPVGLCLVLRDSGMLVFANTLALEWLGIAVGDKFPSTPDTDAVINKIISANNLGTVEQLSVAGGRTLYVAYAPTRYKQQNVILCAFADVSAHAEIERNLAQAKAAADDASEAKSNFLATMSHEIRTPLYGALGTVELLSLTELDAQQRQYVDRIETASQSLMQLISDILDISKIEAGQLQLESIEFNPRELVQSCTGAYSAMAQRKGLLLFSIIATNVPLLAWGDPVRFRQILSNLLSNAIKFTDSGYVIIRLKQVGQTDSSSRLLLEVLDSGLGIDKKQQEKLFTPFYLVEANRHTVSGTGLGLSICARLAELMGTKIQLTSEPKLGSKFYLELDLELRDITNSHLIQPALKGANVLVRTPHPELTNNICAWLQYWGANVAPAAEILSHGEADEILLDIPRHSQSEPVEWKGIHLIVPLTGLVETYSNIDAYSLSSIGFGLDRLLHGKQQDVLLKPRLPQFRLRVLVAEDNPINQATLQGQLEQFGCEVTLASDGEEALALWDISPHDIVLTDVNMPYMNGYELASKLRSEGMTGPILGVTANVMLDEEKRCIDAGMNACLVKPIELRDLAKALHQYAQPELIQSETGGESYLEYTEPNVLDKHRDIFVQSMQDDLGNLEQGFSKGNAEAVGAMLHRMRGALVLAQQRELAARMELLEIHMQTCGLDEEGIFRVIGVIEEIRQLLIIIKPTQ